MTRGATQRKFEALIEHSPHAVVITDQGGRIVLVNRETERMFGYGRAELVGQAVEILVPERLRRGHVRHRDGYLASPSMRSLGANRCLLGRRQDGTEFPTEIGLSYVETGEGVLVMSAIADTTQRRRAEEALRETSETLQALVQASPVGIAILDPDGAVKMWNPAAERIFGWSADEVLGCPLPTVPEGKEEEHRALREEVLKGGASSGVEVQRRAKDGSLLDINLSTAPLRGLDGNISGIVGMMADVTGRKRTEEALREREGWLSTTLSSIGDAVVATDTAGRVTFLNPAAQSLTGWGQEEAAGRPLGDVFKIVSEDTGEPVEDPVTRVMKEGVVVGLANHTALVAPCGQRGARQGPDR
jgi:PAS domain S-box-containing protein